MSEVQKPRPKGYRGLVAFQKARELARETIAVTEKFPAGELFGSVSQMRRAAFSIASNIAEGDRRWLRSDNIRFQRIAHGSCGELDAQLLIAHDAGWVDDAAFEHMEKSINDVSGLIWLLIKSLERPCPKRP